MKKILIIIALAIIPTLMSVSTVSAADQSTMAERIPFTNKPVTPGVPESYIGTYGQCPFYENAMEKGCYPPSDIKCNADWSKCDYIGTTWTPETTVSEPKPKNSTNTHNAPKTSPVTPKTTNNVQNTAPVETKPSESRDDRAEKEQKANAIVTNALAKVESDKMAELKNTEQGVKNLTNKMTQFYIAAAGIVLWIALATYLLMRRPNFIRDALKFYKDLFDKITKRR